MSSLLPIPENLMSGDVKDKLQMKIREAGGAKWSEHTRKLPPLEIDYWWSIFPFYLGSCIVLEFFIKFV